MNLQKLARTLLIVLCISVSLPAFSNPVNPGVEFSSVPADNPTKITDPLARLKEIRNMNMENLSRSEKRELRKEVKQIRKEMKADKKNGIYLSVGAIIIIVLLLILLL